MRIFLFTESENILNLIQIRNRYEGINHSKIIVIKQERNFSPRKGFANYVTLQVRNFMKKKQYLLSFLVKEHSHQKNLVLKFRKLRETLRKC